MPRRSLFSAAERTALLALPQTQEGLIQHYTLSQSDLSLIKRRRGDHNRLGFAVLLCGLRHPGITLSADSSFPLEFLNFVARQLRVEPALWAQYAQREETRYEHLAELQEWLGLAAFNRSYYRTSVKSLTVLAQQTDRAMVLAGALIEELQRQKVILPAVEVIERICGEALTRGTRKVYEALISSFSASQLQQIDQLLEVPGDSSQSTLSWFRQPPGYPNAKHILIHLERLQALQKLGLPEGVAQRVHQNRLLKLAREGGPMTAQHLRELEPKRRWATVIALLLETRSTRIDESIELHDRLMGALFSRAKRQHSERFQESGKSLNRSLRLYSRIGRALLEARQSGQDPFDAIETILPWDAFTTMVSQGEKLVQPDEFDFLVLVGESYSQLRRYSPTLLDTLPLHAAPASQELMTAIDLLRHMNQHQLRKVPEDAPDGFIGKRWESLVREGNGYDRRFYEICALSELKNSLRSGDLWVKGSRQFRDFEEYLLPRERFQQQRVQGELGLPVQMDCDSFLSERRATLEARLAQVERQARKNALPDASLGTRGLKITPLVNTVPEEAERLMRRAYALMPHLKITELLLEVDAWTGFTRHFTHLKTGEITSDPALLLTAILADGINLGLSKMAESCPGTTYARLSWLQSWHIRDETYSAALAELVNAQSERPFAREWGEGNTSSSDGQWFHAGGVGQAASHLNARYGKEPGVTFYTHLSDQYAPFHTRVINAPVRDATYVLDGLLYHESDLRIEEHYTDTAGFTDHVFGLMHLLGYRFAPRIRDLKDKKIYIVGDARSYPTLSPLVGDTIQFKTIQTHWDELLRLAASIQQGTAGASLMLRKLGSYSRQNGLALALRELGRIERTLFTLDWMQSPELRRRVQVGLNKGEARNALARAVFFNPLGELRDRSFENQRYRASGLNLIVAAIILWNTVYLERAIESLKAHGYPVEDALMAHLSPLGWEHINLTGDYIWRQAKRVQKGKFRPLRPFTGS